MCLRYLKVKKKNQQIGINHIQEGISHRHKPATLGTGEHGDGEKKKPININHTQEGIGDRFKSAGQGEGRDMT
jgi:hypothetical protein